tara:strand:- start:80 stop:886 length:807 start_codon:yes stop_codon:yes gene_type:complete
MIQIILATFVVPKAQDTARSFLRTSSVNVFENLIKEKKFNDTIKGVTLYSDSKDNNGNLNNIYLKKQNDKKNFQITYAEKGIFIKKGQSQVLELFNGETINVIDNKTTRFRFSQSDFNFLNLETNTTTYIKTQEVSTEKLIKCYLKLKQIKFLNINSNDIILTNCVPANLSNILKELYKRTIVPFYMPILMLVILSLILKSKENSNYFRLRILIFLIGMVTLIASEMTLKFIKTDLLDNLKIVIIPLILTMIIYSMFYTFLNNEKRKK